MAKTLNTNLINDFDGYLLDAKNVKGSFIVVSSQQEMTNLLNWVTVVEGSFCCYNGTLYTCKINNGVKSWVEFEVGDNIPVIYITVDMVVSQSPLTIQFTTGQDAIIMNDKYKFISFDTTSLGVGVSVFSRSRGDVEGDILFVNNVFTYNTTSQLPVSSTSNTIIYRHSTMVGKYSVLTVAGTEDIPTNVSQLENDANYQDDSQVESAVTSAIVTHNEDSTAHQDIRDSIPTTTSQLTNDSNFVEDAIYEHINKSDVDANTDARHTHSNKTLLDSYTHTDSDIGDAILNMHTHSNSSVLNNLTQSVINNSHTHTNKTLLDGITSDNLVNATEKQTWNNKQSAISDLDDIREGAEAGSTALQPSGVNSLAKTSGISLATTLGSDNTTVPTSKAVRDYVGSISSGVVSVSVQSDSGLQKTGTEAAPIIGVDSSHIIPTTTSFNAKLDASDITEHNPTDSNAGIEVNGTKVKVNIPTVIQDKTGSTKESDSFPNIYYQDSNDIEIDFVSDIPQWTLTNSGVTAGTYNNVTVDTKGRVTSGSNADYQTGTQVAASIAAEATLRINADNALDSRLDVIEGSDTTTGSIKKALKDAKSYVDGLNTTMSGRVKAIEDDYLTSTDKSELNTSITDVSNKLNKTVMSDTSVSVSGDNVSIGKSYVNISSGSTSSDSDSLPLATETTAGLMSYTDYNAIRQNTQDIAALKGQNVRLSYTTKSNPTATEIENFVKSQGYTDATKWASISVVVKATNHIWRYYTNDGWSDIGVDTVTKFTNTTPGIIQGADVDGKVYAETDGTGSVKGWDTLKNRVTNVENNKSNKSETVSTVSYDSTNKKITKTINGTTSDVVSASTLKTAMSLNNVENKSSSTIRSEITSSNVTSALGFTPYNSTNPNGYQDSTDVDLAIDTKLVSYATIDYVDNQISLVNANFDNYYNKTSIDNKLSAKFNTSDFTATNIIETIGNNPVQRANKDGEGNTIGSTYATKNELTNKFDKTSFNAQNIIDTLGTNAVNRATKDSNGNTIDTTYATKTDVSTALDEKVDNDDFTSTAIITKLGDNAVNKANRAVEDENGNNIASTYQKSAFIINGSVLTNGDITFSDLIVSDLLNAITNKQRIVFVPSVKTYPSIDLNAQKISDNEYALKGSCAITNDTNITIYSGAINVNATTATGTYKSGLANNYVLPTASQDTLGGVKIGEGLNIDNNGTISVGAPSVPEYATLVETLPSA